MKNQVPTPNMKVADVLKIWPETVFVFLKYHMGCVGCAMASFETLSEVAAIYKLSLLDILNDLHLAIQRNEMAVTVANQPYF
jgi:hybrid cluster-associated redox disulfide protein